MAAWFSWLCIGPGSLSFLCSPSGMWLPASTAEFLHSSVMSMAPLCQQEFLVFNQVKAGLSEVPRCACPVDAQNIKNSSCKSQVLTTWWSSWTQNTACAGGTKLETVTWRSFLVSDFHVVFVNSSSVTKGSRWSHFPPLVLTYYCQIIYLCLGLSFQLELWKKKSNFLFLSVKSFWVSFLCIFLDFNFKIIYLNMWNECCVKPYRGSFPVSVVQSQCLGFSSEIWRKKIKNKPLKTVETSA